MIGETMTLHCPRCGGKWMVPKDASDPAEAVLVKALCLECDPSSQDRIFYYDGDGCLLISPEETNL